MRLLIWGFVPCTGIVDIDVSLNELTHSEPIVIPGDEFKDFFVSKMAGDSRVISRL